MDKGYAIDDSRSCITCGSTKYKRKENLCTGYTTCKHGEKDNAKVCWSGPTEMFDECKSDTCPVSGATTDVNACNQEAYVQEDSTATEAGNACYTCRYKTCTDDDGSKTALACTDNNKSTAYDYARKDFSGNVEISTCYKCQNDVCETGTVKSCTDNQVSELKEGGATAAGTDCYTCTDKTCSDHKISDGVFGSATALNCTTGTKSTEYDYNVSKDVILKCHKCLSDVCATGTVKSCIENQVSKLKEGGATAAGTNCYTCTDKTCSDGGYSSSSHKEGYTCSRVDFAGNVCYDCRKTTYTVKVCVDIRNKATQNTIETICGYENIHFTTTSGGHQGHNYGPQYTGPSQSSLGMHCTTETVKIPDGKITMRFQKMITSNSCGYYSQMCDTYDTQYKTYGVNLTRETIEGAYTKYEYNIYDDPRFTIIYNCDIGN